MPETCFNLILRTKSLVQLMTERAEEAEEELATATFALKAAASQVNNLQDICDELETRISEMDVTISDLRADCAAAQSQVSSAAVLPFSKLNHFIFGYFDPENIFLDNKNN